MIYGSISLLSVLDVPNWPSTVPDVDNFPARFETVIPIIHFGFLMSTIIFLVFSGVFIVFTYGTLKKIDWVWTTGIIISTIFLAIFSLMLASFIVNVLMFKDDFSITGLVSTILVFLIDLGIIYYLTRPKTKLYFEKK